MIGQERGATAMNHTINICFYHYSLLRFIRTGGGRGLRALHSRSKKEGKSRIKSFK